MTRFGSVVLALAVGCTTPISTNELVPTKPTSARESPTEGYVAMVTAKRSNVLAAAFTGRIDAILVRPNQVVHEGDLLATQDTTELRNQLRRARADEASARTIAEQLRVQAVAKATNLRMARMLFEHGAGTRNTIVESSTEAAEAQAFAIAERSTVDARGASADSIQREIDQAEIRAPFDGVVATVHVTEGAVVTAGTTILRILDPSHLIVKFAVPPTDDTPLENNARVELAIRNHERRITAVITAISHDIEFPMSDRIVEADIDDQTLRPGELALTSVGHVTIASAADGPLQCPAEP